LLHISKHLETKRIVITGGPSTGKTAVIDKLEAMGYTCLHEVIRSMTLEEKKQDSDLSFKTNPIVSVADPMAFNISILEARIAQYKSSAITSEELVFFDRGIPDVLAYMDCFNQNYNKKFINACKSNKYDIIFIMPPWQEIHVSDSGRFETFEESVMINDCLVNSYSSYGYDVKIVPKDSITNRVEFILKHIKEVK
jgi:predicted ATPase